MEHKGNDWLNLTQEQPMEPDFPICDPHHHLWDRRFTKSSATQIPYPKYLLEDFLADIGSGHNVRSSVFVEADAMYAASGPEELQSVGEVEFVQGAAAASASGIYGESRVAAAIIGYANLKLGDNVSAVLENLQAASPNRFRGIRHRVAWDPDPLFSRHPAPNEKSSFRNEGNELYLDEFRRGASVLAKMGLIFDGLVYHPQLHDMAKFARELSDLPIVLNHIGGLIRIGGYANNDAEVFPAWKEGISAVAECPNVVIKLGGMGMPIVGFDWHEREKPIGSQELANDMGPYIEHCINEFGPQRCMFESNFPVDKVSYSYNIMYNAFKLLTKGFRDEDRKAMLHDNAVTIYKI